MGPFIAAGIFIILCGLAIFFSCKYNISALDFAEVFLLGMSIILITKGCDDNVHRDYHVEEIAEKYSIIVIGDKKETIKTYCVAVKEVNSSITYVVEVPEDRISLYEDEYFRCKKKDFYDSYDRVISKTYNYNE